MQGFLAMDINYKSCQISTLILYEFKTKNCLVENLAYTVMYNEKQLKIVLLVFLDQAKS